MGLLHVLFRLLVPPHIESAPIPDDWPPEGSLHFLEYPAGVYQTVPDTHVVYEFSSNWGEDDYRITGLSLEVMEQLCASRQILTKIKSVKEVPKKQKFPPERFPVRYRRFLEKSQPQISTWAKGDTELFVLTEGFAPDAFFAFKEIDRSDDCFFDFYVLPDSYVVSNAEKAAELVTADQYDMQLTLSEYGPCALDVVLNAKTVDAESVQRAIQNVCEKHDILFMNPPEK